MTPARIGADRVSVWAWVLYDLANTIFALGVIGRYFPEWLSSMGQPDSALAPHVRMLAPPDRWRSTSARSPTTPSLST